MMRSTTGNAIKRALNVFLTSQCEIRRVGVSRGERGESVKTPYSVASGVPCRIITQKGSAQAKTMRIGNRESMVDIYRVIFRDGVDLRIDDQIVIGAEVYNVSGIEDKLTDSVFVGALVVRERSRNGA